MSVFIEQLKVNSFRGIRDLEIDSVNHVNIIAGNNNCGKTSVLEAMMLLRSPFDLTNLLRISRIRHIIPSLGAPNIYESFINLFPKDGDKTSINISTVSKEESLTYKLDGKKKRIIIEPDELIRRRSSSHRSRAKTKYDQDSVETDDLVSVEADAFEGEIQFEHGKTKKTVKIDFDAYMPISGREITKDAFINMTYLPPFHHVFGSNFNQILRNEPLKEICLTILRLFDSKITDLLILEDDNRRPVEYVKHEILGNMPLSTYGDGIKKVLSIANGIANAAGGILLIDEAETSIHSKYYYDIFRFIVKACKQLNVQLFLTTHSIEAIDGFLGTQDYDKQSDYDDIVVITLKKDTEDRKTYSRVLTGRKVYANREQFGFEVRL